VLDTSLRVAACNARYSEWQRLSPNETIGRSFLEMLDKQDRGTAEHHLQACLKGDTSDGSVTLNLAGDHSTTLSVFFSRMTTAQGRQLLLFCVNVTDTKELEVRYAHSQKMQAVGQLAGGIAHDFNNLLTAMIGFCDLLLMRHPAGDASFVDIMQIKQNANRAANLVRQLLAFSRRQTLQAKFLDVTDVLSDLSNLISRLIGEGVSLSITHGRDLGWIKADQGQLEQVLINLAVNARDAMHGGGKLSLHTRVEEVAGVHSIPDRYFTPAEDEPLAAGSYVVIEVRDTGTGIPRELLSKIFEPFFSTKEVGAGTGLGLATVYGIIKQSGGNIYVDTVAGEGTCFLLYLPRYEVAVSDGEPVEEEKPQVVDLTGRGTLLIVEDEAAVRSFSVRALRNKGYQVLEADCAESALEIIAEQGETIDLIISDVVMPGMNGPAMVATIRERFPSLGVIFMSGYAEEDFLRDLTQHANTYFLPKPYTLQQLATKVKEVMS
jgi:two-component system cell cycle sensor histidine kinase/response regulator CckA